MKILITIISAIMMMNTCSGQDREQAVRPATQAGRFYEADAQVLSAELDSFLNLHKGDKQYSELAALIVPHAGYYYSGNVAAAAYSAIADGKKYKRIFLLGPSHHAWLNGASVNNVFDCYETPLGRVKVDREVATELIAADSIFSYRPEAHDREHCLEVQLPFLQRRMKEVPPIVPIIISTNDYSKLQRIASVLKPYFTDENLFVISSDFSHYPNYDDACEIDAKTGRAVESGNVEEFISVLDENASSGKRNLATSACGELAIATLMLMMDKGCEVKHLMYQNSGDVEDGDHSRVVGYHAFAIVRKESNDASFILTDEDKRALKEIALTSIKDSLAGKGIQFTINNSQFTINNSWRCQAAEPSAQCTMLNSKCGAFVSLHKTAGCADV